MEPLSPATQKGEQGRSLIMVLGPFRLKVLEIDFNMILVILQSRLLQ